MPKAAMLCPTYNRPRLVGQLIAMFLAQDYPDKELVILEDSGIFGDGVTMAGDGWRLISTASRYISVGAKRNALAKETDAEILIVADDDDYYLPWHISAAVAALERKPWAQPRQSLDWWTPDYLGRYWSFGPRARGVMVNGQQDPACEQDAADACYGGSWSYRADAFRASGGYPELHGNGDDLEFCRAMFRLFGSSADTISPRHPDPSYIYSRDKSGSWHASEFGLGTEPLKRLASVARANPADLVIALPDWYWTLEIPQVTEDRRW